MNLLFSLQFNLHYIKENLKNTHQINISDLIQRFKVRIDFLEILVFILN